MANRLHFYVKKRQHNNIIKSVLSVDRLGFRPANDTIMFAYLAKSIKKCLVYKKKALPLWPQKPKFRQSKQ